MKQQELLKAALDALERLLNLFKIDRYVNLVLSSLAFFLLLYAGYLLVSSGTADKATIYSIFGSSGLVVASTSRITFFFNKAFNLIEELIKKLMEEPHE